MTFCSFWQTVFFPSLLSFTTETTRGQFLDNKHLLYRHYHIDPMPVWIRISQQAHPIKLRILFSPIFFTNFGPITTLFPFLTKESFFIQCTKIQLITLQNFNIQTCFSQFLWFFSFKGQISRNHLILLNAYKLMCFDRNIKGNRDVKFLECIYSLLQRCVKLT